MLATEVFEQHLESLQISDLDAICDLYAEDVVVIDSEGAGIGHEYLRKCYTRHLEMVKDEKIQLNVSSAENVISVSWHSVAEKNAATVRGTDTLMVRGNLIELHSFQREIVKERGTRSAVRQG